MARKKRNIATRSRESIQRDMKGSSLDRQYIGRDNHFLNPKLQNVRMENPGVSDGGITVLRFWPMLDPEAPTTALLNGRQNALDVGGLSGMSLTEPVMVVNYAGIKVQQGKNFILEHSVSYVIARSKSSLVEGVNYRDEPYVKLYNTAKAAFDSGEFSTGRTWNPKWNQFFKGRKGEGQELRKPDRRHFGICSIYQMPGRLDLDKERLVYKNSNSKGGKDEVREIDREGFALGDRPDDPLVVINLPQMLGRGILELCCREKKEYDGDYEKDPSLPFVYGDPTGIFDPETGTVKGGLFFSLYNAKQETIAKHTSFDGKLNDIDVHYAAAVSKKFTGPDGQVRTPDLTSDQVDNIFNKHVYLWRSDESDTSDSFLLYEPPIEERCVWIAKAFKPASQLVEFCWSENPEYLRFDEVRGILQNRAVAKVEKPDDSDDEDDADEETDDRPKSSKKDKPAAKKGKSAAALVDDFEDDSELDEDEIEDIDEGDDDDDTEDEDHGKSSGKAKGKARKESFDDDFEDEDGDEDKGSKAKGKAKGGTKGPGKAKGKAQEEVEEDDSDDFDDEDDAEEDDDSDVEDIDEEEEEPKPTKAKAKAKPAKGKVEEEEDESDDFDDDSDDDSDEEDDEESEDEDLEPTNPGEAGLKQSTAKAKGLVRHAIRSKTQDKKRK